MNQSLHRIAIHAFESLYQRRGTFAHWRSLERSQWLMAAELQREQLASLQRLLTFAAQKCPYYRHTWNEHGLAPDQVTSHDDFTRWPVIDRDVIRLHRTEMRALDAGLKLLHKATGGSSGVPLAFDYNQESDDRRMAAWHRGYGWANAAPGTKQWYLWGGAVGQVSWKKKWKDKFYNALYRRRVASSFHMSAERLDEYLRSLNQYRPDAIVAYTNPLYTFARLLDERNLRPFSPRSIVVGAEKLHDFQRTLIERVFQAPVFETYGSREFMLIGAECDRHEGLHLTYENLLVEILDDDGHATPAGEEGNVVISDLTNYGMPFIRYANGDRAVAGFKQCSCGRGLPLLSKVVGRRLDMLTTPDGRCVPGEFFPHLVKEFTPVRRFQVVQETSDSIELKIVTDERWTSSQQAELRNQIVDVLGDAVRFTITVVDDIPLTSAGKLRVVVNRVGEQASHSTAAN